MSFTTPRVRNDIKVHGHTGIYDGGVLSQSSVMNDAGGTLTSVDLPHNLLSATHSDTVVQTVSRGSTIVGNSSDHWDELVLGAAGKILRSDGTDALYSDTLWPNVGTSGGVLGFTSTTQVATSVLLTASALVLGGGAGATPTPMASLGTTVTVLHGNAAGAPTFGAVSLTADVSGVLPIVSGGTGNTTGTATINANLTGHVTSVGNAAVLGSFTSAQLLAALTDKTGTGKAVFATSPTFTTSIGVGIAPAAAADVDAGALPAGATTSMLRLHGGYSGNVNTIPSIDFMNTAATTNFAAIRFPLSNSGNDVDIALWAYLAGSMTEKFRVTGGGKAGFGITAPAYRIDALGTIRATETASETLGFIMQNRNSTRQWAFGADVVSVDDGGYFIFDVTSSGLVLSITKADTASGGLATSGGLVGIGVATASAKLHIINAETGVVATKIQAAAAQTADIQQWLNSAGTVITKVGADGTLTVTGFRGGRTTFTTASYTMVAGDYIIASATMGTPAARTVNLIAAATAGAGYTITIKDEAGSASTFNVTVDGSGAETIDGSLTKIINVNYGSVTLYCTGTTWFTRGAA